MNEHLTPRQPDTATAVRLGMLLHSMMDYYIEAMQRNAPKAPMTMGIDLASGPDITAGTILRFGPDEPCKNAQEAQEKLSSVNTVQPESPGPEPTIAQNSCGDAPKQVRKGRVSLDDLATASRVIPVSDPAVAFVISTNDSRSHLRVTLKWDGDASRRATFTEVIDFSEVDSVGLWITEGPLDRHLFGSREALVTVAVHDSVCALRAALNTYRGDGR